MTTMTATKTPQEIRANCARGADCWCTESAKPWACSNWGRSSLACPAIVSAYTQTIAKRGPMKDREELRRAGERSILNRRNFSPSAKPGDLDPKDIRGRASDRKRKLGEMGARKYLEKTL